MTLNMIPVGIARIGLPGATVMAIARKMIL